VEKSGRACSPTGQFIGRAVRQSGQSFEQKRRERRVRQRYGIKRIHSNNYSNEYSDDGDGSDGRGELSYGKRCMQARSSRRRQIHGQQTIRTPRRTEDRLYPWLSASSQHFHPSMRMVPDSFAPPAFNGTNTDADTWLAHFRRYAEYRQLADRDITHIFPLFLKDSAIDWYDTLPVDMRSDLDSLLGKFKAYFGKTELDYVFTDETVFTRVQRPNEKARDYISQMQKLAKRVPHLEDEILRWVILRGLRPWIKASIIAQTGDLKSVADIFECAKVAESAGLGKDKGSSDATKINQLMQEAGREEVQQLTAKMAKMSISAVQPRSPTPKRRQQRVSFQGQRADTATLHDFIVRRPTLRFAVHGRPTGTLAVNLVRQIRRFSFVTIVIVLMR